MVMQDIWKEIRNSVGKCMSVNYLVGERSRFRVGTGFYQSPLILTELFQHNLINVSYLMACYLYQVMMTLHFLNGVANDAESTYKSKITSKSLV